MLQNISILLYSKTASKCRMKLSMGDECHTGMHIVLELLLIDAARVTPLGFGKIMVDMVGGAVFFPETMSVSLF